MRGAEFTMESGKIKGEYLSGIYSEIATLLGIDAALKLHANYKGQQVFFPMELFSKDFIKSQIIEEYNGYNVKQLATKYGYTEKWVRKILKEHIDECDSGNK
ncbi:MAG: Mor transcription activator family protein [Eubacterium sp.]|nr:Mor transcription activator family protein [Eubacterium sp.]